MQAATPCPACAAPMRNQAFERKYGGMVALDICLDCKQIWFDEHESAQLAPDGLLRLFRLIHAHQDSAARPAAERMDCPHCRARLSLTHDLQRSNRLLYYRCLAGHGRLTAFYQFLREKNFVRDLTKPEVAQLKAEVKQVRCSGCGAPVDLQQASACGFCKAPIAILDANAVAQALQALDAARSRQRPMDPAQAGLPHLIEAYAGPAGSRDRFAARANAGFGTLMPEIPLSGLQNGPALFDLVGAGIGLLADWFDD